MNALMLMVLMAVGQGEPAHRNPIFEDDPPAARVPAAPRVRPRAELNRLMSPERTEFVRGLAQRSAASHSNLPLADRVEIVMGEVTAFTILRFNLEMPLKDAEMSMIGNFVVEFCKPNPQPKAAAKPAPAFEMGWHKIMVKGRVMNVWGYVEDNGDIKFWPLSQSPEFRAVWFSDDSPPSAPPLSRGSVGPGSPSVPCLTG